ncbi:MAG: hypothetical protein IPM55_09295 [Acidobacteria bacterium]|nr:hypothetical protein [Acidobacteriota bacterium]
MNRFIWDLRYPGVDGAFFGGPIAAPGKYQARLSIGSRSQMRSFEVKMDPRVAADGVTVADLQEQLDFSLRVTRCDRRSSQAWETGSARPARR